MGRSRFSLGSLLAVWITASSVWPHDGTPPRESPAQSSFSTVQDSFESLKKKAPSETEVVLPKISVPELSAPSPGKLEIPTIKPNGTSSRNWLVDAVVAKRLGDGADAGQAHKNSADADSSDPFSLKSGRLADADEFGLAKPGGGIDKTRSGTALGSITAENPLATFMNGWISTQDRAVLLGVGAGSMPSADRGATGAPVLDDALQTALRPSQFLGNEGFKSPVPQSAKNPYLDFFAQGTEPNSLGTRAYLPTPGPPPAASDALGPAGILGSRQSIAPISPGIAPSAFSSPNVEAKYFKQLKRF